MPDPILNRRLFMRTAGAATAGAFAAAAAAQTRRPQSQPRAGGQLRLPDPMQRQGSYAEVNGARIFYQVSGTGAPMMLLHGYPLSGALFERVRDDLSRRFRVITLDHRGYGMSRAPAIPDSIAIYANDALAVMQQLGVERAHVGGMSMGGPILFEMYRQAPERFSGMMLIDTIAAPANPAEKGLWMGVADMARQGGVSALIPVLLHEMLSGDTRIRQPELGSYLTAVMKQASQDAAIGGALALAQRPDSTQLLGSIRVPTQIIVGLNDHVYPIEIARMMNEQIASSRLDIIDGAAHAAIFEAPQRASSAIMAFHSPGQGVARR